MLKKIAKKQLLGLLTATAIVVTTVGSFAVWDKLTAEKTSSEITITKPLDTTMEDITLTRVENASGDDAIYEGTVTVKTDNIPIAQQNNYNLALSSEIVGTAPDGVSTVIGKDGATAASAAYTDESYKGTSTDYKVRVKATRASALVWSQEQKVQVKVSAAVTPKASNP